MSKAEDAEKLGYVSAAPGALPQVGIFYAVGEKLFIDSTPLSEAGDYGEHLVHERSHDEYWLQLVKKGAVPRAGYEEFPRGRVAYRKESGTFIVLADVCILGEEDVFNAILARLHLPIEETETGTIPIYRCYRCSGRPPLADQCRLARKEETDNSGA